MVCVCHICQAIGGWGEQRELSRWMERDPSFARLARERDECLTPNANNKLELMEMRWMARKREIPSIRSINDLPLIQRRLPAISPIFACLTLICGEACCILL